MSNTKRYQVTTIRDGEGYNAIGKLLSEHDSYQAAKDDACEVANEYRYGVAVVDTASELIDWGDEWTDYAGDDVAAPATA